MNPRVDWAAFLARHDMRVSALPTGWTDAPHFGNAMVGSMLYVRDGHLCIEVFRADVCDHRPESYGWIAYSRPRFRIGYFVVETTGTPTGCELRTSLWDAEMTGYVATSAGRIEIRHFVHAEDMAIVTEFSPSGGEGMPVCRWMPARAETTRPGYPTNDDELEDYAARYGAHHKAILSPAAANPDGHLEEHDGVTAWIQPLLTGGQYATAWTAREAAGRLTLTATIANSYPETTASVEAVREIRRFVARDSAERVESHRSWWHDYYRRSFVSLPDARIESLYWQTIYRYGCTSRTGRYYVDTSGIWFQGGQWPYTTNDWNTQSAHWGVYAANRLEQGGDVVRRLAEFSQNLIDSVRPEEWQVDSAYLAVATPGDFSGTRDGDMRYYDLVGNLPWLLHNAWWHYRYSMDDAMLRDTLYPLLRRAVNLYLHLAEDGPDGRIHLAATYSPETGVYRDANFDLALFKWACHVLIQSCGRLGIDDPLKAKWQDVIERLVEFPVDANGFMLGDGESADPDHRHFSHLLMIYPLYLVNAEQEHHRNAILRSAELAHNGSGASPAGRGLEAMVQTHAAPISASIGDGDRALEGLERLADELEPNGLWPCTGNPCIESTLAIANIVQSMLIQSWSDPAAASPGPIRVFPALPSAWTDVEFHDLRAEGAFLVSADCRNRSTTWVRIESLAGEPCRVQPGFVGGFDVDGRPGLVINEESPGVFTLDLQRGDVVTLRSKETE